MINRGISEKKITHDSASEQDMISSFMTNFSIETTPNSAKKVESFSQILRPRTTVYITFLPGSDYKDTVKTARRLRDEGMVPAPHFAARSISSPEMLNDYLARASGEAGVDKVLLIAGASKEPIGPYSDTMQLLETGAFDREGIKQIGLAGHPEGSPDMSDEAISNALNWKNTFAENSDANFHIVTQFCFEADPIIIWDKKINSHGNKLPIHIGIPGIAKISTLLNYSISCGIGNSLQFIKKQSKNIANLIKTQSPDILVRDLALYTANNKNSSIKGVHLYPLGGLVKSAEWGYASVDKKFTLNNQGFKVY